MLVIAARLGFGVIITPALAGMGMLLGRVFHDFYGFTTWSPLYWSLMVGVGIGAGMGGYVAWLAMSEGRKPNIILMFMLVAVVGMGLVGAMVGFEFAKTLERCVGWCPALARPMAYSILWATVASNAAALILNIAGHLVWPLPRAPLHLFRSPADRLPR